MIIKRKVYGLLGNYLSSLFMVLYLKELLILTLYKQY